MTDHKIRRQSNAKTNTIRTQIAVSSIRGGRCELRRVNSRKRATCVGISSILSDSGTGVGTTGAAKLSTTSGVAGGSDDGGWPIVY